MLNIVTIKKNLEIEIKLKVINLADIKKKITQLGFTAEGERQLEYNIVFDFEDFSLNRKGLLLRLRKFGQVNILTLKKPVKKSEQNQNYKIREEVEVSVINFENMRHILQTIGLKPVFIYEKNREYFKNKDIQLMFDETPIGNFIELEGEKSEIDKIAIKLGFGPKDYITKSYRALFKQENKSGHMTF